MVRFLLFTLLLTTFQMTITAQGDRIPPEVIGDALTKSMQGELAPAPEQLPGLAEINLKYASRIAEKRSAHSSLDDMDDLTAEWENELRQVFNSSKFQQFQKMKAIQITELRLAGLDLETAHLAQRLDLTEEQIEAIEVIQSEYSPQIMEIRSGGDPQRIKDRRLRGVNQARDEAVEAVLTEEQIEVYRMEKE